MKHALIFAELLRTPWALEPQYLQTVAAVITRWAFNEPPAPGVMEAVSRDAQMRDARRAQAAQASVDGIAVLPFYGVVTQRPVTQVSGPGTVSTQAFGAMLRAAVEAPGVGGIVIDMNSPGGSAFGVSELADAMRAAEARKPIYVVANSLAASAAYWIASQASQVFAAPGALTGSIGVYTAHEDVSKALDTKGVKVTLVSAGKYKTEGNSFEPLSDEARAHMQAQVDELYAMFTRDVALGRGVPVAQVRNGFGQGRALLPSAAKAAGLIDGVATLDEAIARMQLALQERRVANERRRAEMNALLGRLR
jgi:signal peptide peptidase SppA